MRGNHLARPPQAILSQREKRLIEVLYLDGAFVNLSYAAVADFLNLAYREDNQGCRTGDGVYRFIKKRER